jgi:predicted metal-dependent hydrolase
VRWKKFVSDIGEMEKRRSLRRRIQRLIDKWRPILGVDPADVDGWDLREMKLYWGSTRKAGCDDVACRSGHITFNTEIVKLPPRYVEYVVVHELVHHLTNGHDARFYDLMDRHLPGWRAMQAKIEEPLTQYS